jgi:hypothetical protein
MFNAGVKNDNTQPLLKMAMKHDLDLPSRSLDGIKFEVLYVKCRDVKLRPLLYVLKDRKAQGTKKIQDLVKNEMNTITNKAFERPKRPVYKTWEMNHVKPLRGSKGVRAAMRKWREERRQWMLDEKRVYEAKAKAYRNYIARGIMSVDFKIRMTRKSDGKEMGASFSVFRNGSMRCSGGMFDGKTAKSQLNALHDFMKVAYTVPRKTLKMNRLTATFVANFNLEDLTNIRNKNGVQGNFFRLFRAKYKKAVTAADRIQAVGQSGRLSVPLSKEVSLLITTSGRCQLSIRDGVSPNDAFDAAKTFLRRNLPADSYHNDPINRASKAVKRSKITRNSNGKKVPGVTRGGTTCPKNRKKVNGVCPKTHPHERLNPQGFPCCYKKSGITRAAVNAQKNVNRRKNNNTEVFVQIYMDPRMTKQNMLDLGDVARVIKDKSMEGEELNSGEMTYRILSRSEFRAKGYKSEILLAAAEGRMQESKLIDRLFRAVPWLSRAEYSPLEGYYTKDLHINGRQGTRYPKAELADILRRMGGVRLSPKAQKDDVLFEIRRMVFKTKMDVTNYAGVRSANVIRQVRSNNKGGKSTGNTAANRVPMYLDTRGRLVVGKRVASTFAKADLDRFARSLKINGTGVPKQSLVNQMKAKLKSLNR